ncbi:Fe superoxide dismutase-like protein [Ophiobolus disseminans]|uniref:Fe superoxide dismutase-like protein n=1 Tax=Ophiobolus disseminans TaxID=1469910 RepID=A0A6A7AH60_9PLEO|nr:Fe superoxide dismutase-like protein [Ophiobolus disseminans]
MMIIQSLARRPGAVQPLAGASRRLQRTSPCLNRRAYNVPTLENHLVLQKKGIPGLLTRRGFNTAYTNYEQHMIDELNISTDGTIFANQEPKSLVIETARDPTKAYLFNVASMAFNNHFFFRGINTNPDVQSQPSTEVRNQINRDFSSMETLRETFLGTAEAMFGPGFVWLVQTNDTTIGSFRILPTYLAGSPLSHAHYRRQSHDLNTHNAESHQTLNKVGTFGSAAKQNTGPKKPLGGVDVVPLLCVNTWEHVWLLDYGVRGKRKFLEAWWDKIDWAVVGQNATYLPKQGSSQFMYD